MGAMLTGDAIVALVTLTAMEIVLGLDNVVFIAILTGRLPASQQAPARRLGLTLALVIRIGLLFAISWIMGLTAPFTTVLGHAISGRDLILLGGGLFRCQLRPGDGGERPDDREERSSQQRKHDDREDEEPDVHRGSPLLRASCPLRIARMIKWMNSNPNPIGMMISAYQEGISA